jgi:hypothetical protein
MPDMLRIVREAEAELAQHLALLGICCTAMACIARI